MHTRRMRLMQSGKLVGILDLYASVKSSEALLAETPRQRRRLQPERWLLADTGLTEEVRWRSEEHAAREARLEFRRRAAELGEAERVLQDSQEPARACAGGIHRRGPRRRLRGRRRGGARGAVQLAPGSRPPGRRPPRRPGICSRLRGRRPLPRTSSRL